MVPRGAQQGQHSQKLIGAITINSTLNMFYKERSDLVTSWGFSDFYSRSLKLFFRFSNFVVVL